MIGLWACPGQASRSRVNLWGADAVETSGMICSLGIVEAEQAIGQRAGLQQRPIGAG